MQIFVKHPEIFSCSCNGTFYYNEKMQRRCPEFQTGYVKLDTNNFNFMLPSILYSREVLSYVGGFHFYFDRLTGMDQYFILNIIDKFKSFELNEYLYYARFNPTSNH